MLNLLHVRSFTAVVEAEGFAEAGRRLGIAQPTISQHIRKLEEDLGAVLLVRASGAPVLTEAGAAFLPFARSLLAVAERARHAVAGERLAIGASSNIGIYMLQPFVSSFQSALGSGEVDLWIGRNTDVAARVASRELDIGVIEWTPEDADLRADRWRREPMVVIVPPQHPWAALDEIPREALFDEPMIGGEPGTGTGRLLRETFGEEADRIRVVRNLGSTEAVKHAVKSGLGVSLVVQSAVEEEVRHGTLKALKVRETEIAKDLMVIRPGGLPESGIAAAFLSHIGVGGAVA